MLCFLQIFGAAAILLATKVEECPRSVRDVSLASWEYRVKAARRAEAAALREYLGNQVSTLWVAYLCEAAYIYSCLLNKSHFLLCTGRARKCAAGFERHEHSRTN